MNLEQRELRVAGFVRIPLLRQWVGRILTNLALKEQSQSNLPMYHAWKSQPET